MNKKRINAVTLNPYHSVNKICLDKDTDKYCIGVKDVKQIPYSLIEKLINTGEYVLHTLDAHSFGGRAIDLNVKNPITGKPMTGSSSGTAVNVFAYFNDLGIGTDGGGSVLAPALALNLFGFISPLIEKEHVSQFAKKSTDGIEFTPSIGFMTRDFDLMKDTIAYILDIKNIKKQECIYISKKDNTNYAFKTTKIDFEDVYGDREPNIQFLNSVLPKCDFLISYEGPVDVNGFGDSVFGHYDDECKQIQRNAKKGLLRVANMVNATAITIPDKAFAKGWVCICESKPEKIALMLKTVETMVQTRSKLVERYFSNLEMYNETGFRNKGE